VLLLKIWDSIQIPDVVGYEATFKYSKSISSKESPGWSKLLSSDTYIWLTAVASNYSQKGLHLTLFRPENFVSVFHT
jgi:hypothetical protein